MTQDVQQWLTEIQSLQQRLAHTSQERAAAYEQVSRWQRSYQTEAQQRRKDIHRLQIVIYRLDQENKRLKQQFNAPSHQRFPRAVSNESGDNQPECDEARAKEQSLESSTTIPHSSESSQHHQNATESSTDHGSREPSSQSLESTTQLQNHLDKVLAECDRLAKALSQEQADHEQTRQTLMNALGDTVEQLERERKRYAAALQPQPKTQSNAQPKKQPQKQPKAQQQLPPDSPNPLQLQPSSAISNTPPQT